MSDSDPDEDEVESLEESVFEDETFEMLPFEEPEPEESQFLEQESRFVLRPLDLVMKETVYDRLRYSYNSRLSKVVQDWMKTYGIRGLDYYNFLMLMLKFFVTRVPECPKSDRLGMVFTDESESGQSTSVKSENETEDLFREYFEELKLTHPQLMENLIQKEQDRQKSLLTDIQQINGAIKAFMEAKYKRETEKKKKKMLRYKQKKKNRILLKEKKYYIFLINSLINKAFPILPKAIPPEVFDKLGIDREIFDRHFSVMDEDDLMYLYEVICGPKENEEEKEESNTDDEDILRKRGRFPFKTSSVEPAGEEVDVEGEHLNLAKWEHMYWRRQEEMENMCEGFDLCQLMLVRSGTSWKQELGYMEGWSDTDQLGKEGRKAMEKVAWKIWKEGCRFDYVLTSTLKRSWKAADLLLMASGQEAMDRHAAWELNPRHLGRLEGETELGSTTRWGWLPLELFKFRTPPAIRDDQCGNLTVADPEDPEAVPKAESILQVQARLAALWPLIEAIFNNKGKRRILACAHKDSIEAVLCHLFHFCPSDLTAWQPSYTTPIILSFYKCGDRLYPAYIDFLCGAGEADRQIDNLTVCWLKRFIDRPILSHKALAEIRKKLENPRELPDFHELWTGSFIGLVKDFESDEEKIGRILRKLENSLWRGPGLILDNIKLSNVDGEYKRFFELVRPSLGMEGLDNYSLTEKISWIVKRDMPVKMKIRYLKSLLGTSEGEEKEKLLKQFINAYEDILESRFEDYEMDMEDYSMEEMMDEHFEETPEEDTNEEEEEEEDAQ